MFNDGTSCEYFIQQTNLLEWYNNLTYLHILWTVAGVEKLKSPIRWTNKFPQPTLKGVACTEAAIRSAEPHRVSRRRFIMFAGERDESRQIK